MFFQMLPPEFMVRFKIVVGFSHDAVNTEIFRANSFQPVALVILEKWRHQLFVLVCAIFDDALVAFLDLIVFQKRQSNEATNHVQTIFLQRQILLVYASIDHHWCLFNDFTIHDFQVCVLGKVYL